MREQPSEDALARRFLEGDPEAIRRAEALVQRVIRFKGYFIPRQEWADLVQEVLFHLWRALDREGVAAAQSFDAFARAIAYRRCVDWMRGQRPAVEVDPRMTDSSAAPQEALLKKEREELARRVLARLREPCRRLIRLHAAMRMSYREIAKIQGRSESALRSQMSECLKEARNTLRRIVEGRRK